MGADGTLRRRRLALEKEAEEKKSGSEASDSPANRTKRNGLLPCRTGLGVAAALVPISAALIAGATVSSCYLLTESQTPFIDKGIIFPAISFLGVSGDAKLIYQVGFATTGLLLLCTVFLLNVIVASHLAKSGILVENQTGGGTSVDFEKSVLAASRAVKTGAVSAMGVLLQGIFVLEMKPGWQSIIHWAGALIFMMGAQAHAQEVILLYEKTASPALHNLLRGSLEWKRACINAPAIIFVVPIGLQIVRVFLGLDAGAVVQNAMGIVQWGIIASFVLFFVSYAYDCWRCINSFGFLGPPAARPAADD
mmetsp:Transcript_20980/g.37378  ORF Transcript_20980/g.37378 Transcript_20980/m.37378 type:complete len:308 (+) Transcript_20980:64-987(+)